MDLEATRIQNIELERKRSLQLQRLQAMFYLVGGLCFTGGSCMYITKIYENHESALSFGGWLFVIGGLLFICGDLQDWWNHRSGYCFEKLRQTTLDDVSLSQSFEASNQSQTTKIELNVFGSICGTIFYATGCLFFLPIFEYYEVIGEWFFIVGATFAIGSLLWKMYRTSARNDLDENDHRFLLRRLLNDIPSLIMDIFSLLGNLSFFVGTIFFLPYNNKRDAVENRAASLFIFGSLCFVASSICLQYTLFCYRRR